MNGTQQKKTIFGNTLSNFDKLMNNTNVGINENTMTIPITIPKNKEELWTSIQSLNQSLNKANKVGILDLEKAAYMRNVIQVLTQIIEVIVRTCYSNENITTISQQLSQIIFPEPEKIKNMWENLTEVLNLAQVKGAYDSIEESGMIFDSLKIIGMMLGSICAFTLNQKKILDEEKEKI